MNTIDYIITKFNIGFDDKTPMPIEIANVGRNNLAGLLRDLDFKIGVEVGVAAGEYSEILCNLNPQMKLYGIDPFLPHRGYRDYTRESTFRKLQEDAHTRLDKFPNYQFVKKFSLEAVNNFLDSSLDFVYIDANHNFQNIANDIVEWSKKVKVGGIISGHDYHHHRQQQNIHVYQVVNGFTDAYRIRPWFVLGSQKRIRGEIRDVPRSWMWVKN